MNTDIVNTMPVVEFAESILGIELYPQQVAILKDYYGEPLSVWERQVVDRVGSLRKKSCNDK